MCLHRWAGTAATVAAGVADPDLLLRHYDDRRRELSRPAHCCASPLK